MSDIRADVQATLNWQSGLKFSGVSRWGHEISTDGAKKAGGNEDGYQPLELMLFGLAGCTGIDVVNIASKMRQKISDVTVDVKAEQREEHPRAFTKVHIEYTVTGTDLDPEKIERAINLSEEKYCSVSATMAGMAKITHSFTIKEG